MTNEQLWLVLTYLASVLIIGSCCFMMGYLTGREEVLRKWEEIQSINKWLDKEN